MGTAELIAAIVVFGLAGALIVLAVLHFRGRGVLLNNAWLYASQQERETMDKKPYYRQSAIVFCILSGVFVIIGLAILLRDDRLFLLEIPLIIAALVYAIVSTVRIGKNGKNKRG